MRNTEHLYFNRILKRYTKVDYKWYLLLTYLEPVFIEIINEYHSRQLKRYMVLKRLTDHYEAGEFEKKLEEICKKKVKSYLSGVLNMDFNDQMYNQFGKQNKRVAKILQQRAISSGSLSLESIKHIFSNQDYYSITEFDIEAIYNEKKEKWNFSYYIKYDMYRDPLWKMGKIASNKIGRNGNIIGSNYNRFDDPYKLDIWQLDQLRKETISIIPSGNNWMFYDRNIERIKNHPGIEILYGNILKITDPNIKPYKVN